MPLKPYPYQEQGVEFLASRPAAMLCDAPGLGKTMQALLACRRANAERVLVVCPNVVKWQWGAEIDKWLGEDTHWVLCHSGRAGAELFASMAEGYPLPAFFIVHWDALRLLPSGFFKLHWDALIVDELHYICNRKAERTKALKRVKATHKWGLGATPYRNWVDDLWSILNWLEPKTWTSYWRFFRRYLAYLDTTWGRQILDERNLDELSERTAHLVLARSKQEVAAWLPSMTETVLPIDLGHAERAYYERCRKESSVMTPADRELFILNPLQRTTLLRQATNSSRAAACLELLDELQGSHSVVIFTYFRETAESIALGMLGSGQGVAWRTFCLTGDTPEAKREEQLRGFKAAALHHRAVDGDWKSTGALLAMTLGVGGVGLDLDCADVAIFCGMSWSSVEMEQAVERIHRVTSTRPKQVYYLTCRDTLDEVILWAAVAKADRRAFALAALQHIEGGDPNEEMP